MIKFQVLSPTGERMGIHRDMRPAIEQAERLSKRYADQFYVVQMELVHTAQPHKEDE